MPVSSVNSGLNANSPAMKNPLPQRAASQASASTAVNGSGSAGSEPPAQQSAVVSIGGTIPHGVRVGVAAYAAIMNPQAATSMRVEA